jgi:tRNA(fMet)-specific endonuclease VapC
MTYLIDTNIVIYLASNRFPELARKVESIPVGQIKLSAIVFAELALGSANGLAPKAAVLDRLLRQMPLAPFDEAAARAYAKLPFKRARLDRLLAAHALSLDAVLVTRNVGDFADIPGLRIENWTMA